MNVSRLLGRIVCVCVLLAVFFETIPVGRVSASEAFAIQSKDWPPVCPRDGILPIWIKRRGKNKYDDGRFIAIRDRVIYTCEEAAINSFRLSDVLEIRLDPPKEDDPVVKATVQSTVVIPEDQATTKAKITSPLQLSHEKLSGVVMLRAVLNKDRSVGAVQLRDSTEPLLNQTALDAAKKMQFTPATKDGESVSVEKNIALTFTVNSNAKPTNNIELPKPISPIGGAIVPQGMTMLKWNSFPGAIAYEVHIEYSYNNFTWEPYKIRRVRDSETSYSLEYLGEVFVRWCVVAELANGEELKGWWSHFSYTKK